LFFSIPPLLWDIWGIYKGLKKTYIQQKVPEQAGPGLYGPAPSLAYGIHLAP